MANPNNIIHRRRAARNAVKEARRQGKAPVASAPVAALEEAPAPKRKRIWRRKSTK